MRISSELAKNEFIADMLCIADTDWVLGHWYIKVMLNGRSLTDCTAFAGMAQDTLGHTRAMFRFLEEELNLPEHQLEFGRDRDQLHICRCFRRHQKTGETSWFQFFWRKSRYGEC